MKKFKNAFALLLICHFSAYSQTSLKTFIGSWKTTRYDKRNYSTSEENWKFTDSRTGTWNRKLIISDGAIICNLRNPFVWQITTANMLKMTLGKTECKCDASNKKFEEGMDAFIDNLKATYNGELFLHKIKITTAKTISLDDFDLNRN